MFPSTRRAALVAALLLPSLALATDAAKPEDCAYPVRVLWHAPGEGGTHKMGVSVTNRAGQQVPNLGKEVFAILHEGAPVAQDDGFTVAQSKNVIAQAATDEKQADGVAALASDPINYDVYFAVDLTKSMGDDVGGKTKKQFIAEVIRILTAPNKEGQYALFDEQDRVYVAGFTSKVETVTEAPTAQREKLIPALGTLAQFEVRDDAAAVYAAIGHNLNLIKAAAAQYQNPQDPRQAVLITITDSFNGIDPATGRPLRRCQDNDRLNDALRQQIIDTRKAVGEQFKMYVLGLGKVGESDRYKIQGEQSRGCDIAAVQGELLDARSLAAIGSPEITNGGGFQASENPAELAKWLLGHFEALKTAYEITYKTPKERPEPGKYRAAVQILETKCEGVLVEANEFIRQATAKSDTSAAEMALFLGSLLVALLFLPRSIVNLATLGGGEDKPAKKAPAKSSKGKGKKKKK